MPGTARIVHVARGHGRGHSHWFRLLVYKRWGTRTCEKFNPFRTGTVYTGTWLSPDIFTCKGGGLAETISRPRVVKGHTRAPGHAYYTSRCSINVHAPGIRSFRRVFGSVTKILIICRLAKVCHFPKLFFFRCKIYSTRDSLISK